MPRLPRYFVPGVPLHVIQRGNNRMPVFRSSDDFEFYLRCAARFARRQGVAIHAYVLMTNHVHLLVTPLGRSSVPAMMQSIGRMYVQYFNRLCERTGTLWEGRYKATIVDDENYLLTCMRYIELNPVRAGIAESPAEYRWSSYRANAFGANDRMVCPHDVYLRLGRATDERLTVYRDLFADALDKRTLDRIRDATQFGWALGNAGFVRNVSAIARRASRLRKGPRPKAAGSNSIDSDPLL